MTSIPKVFLPCQLDSELFTFGLESRVSGVLYTDILYRSSGRQGIQVSIQTPPLYVPYGISANSRETSTSVLLMIPSHLLASDPKLIEFYDVLVQIEQFAKSKITCSEGQDNGQIKWKSLFQSPPNDSLLPLHPCFAVKVSRSTCVYKSSRKEKALGRLDDIKRGCYARFLISIPCLWYKHPFCGLVIKAVQADVIDSSISDNTLCSKFLFQEEEDDANLTEDDILQLLCLNNDF